MASIDREALTLVEMLLAAAAFALLLTAVVLAIGKHPVLGVALLAVVLIVIDVRGCD